MSISDHFSLHDNLELSTVKRAKRWWQHLTPHRQDMVAMLAPLAAVALFMLAIVSALAYLQVEESSREQEAVQRDLEYTQQQLRLRLLERQEQLGSMAREISNQEMDVRGFKSRATVLINQYPEVQSAIWIDAGKRIRAVAGSPSQALRPGPTHTEVQLDADGDYALQWAMAQHHPVYIQSRAGERGPLLLLFVPLIDRAASTGAVLVELSVDALYRYAVPNEISARYAVSIQDARGNVLAGVALPPSCSTSAS